MPERGATLQDRLDRSAFAPEREVAGWYARDVAELTARLAQQAQRIAALEPDLAGAHQTLAGASVAGDGSAHQVLKDLSETTLDMTQVARVLGVDVSTVRVWVHRGRLDAVRVPSTTLVTRVSLAALQDRMRDRAA